MAAAVRLDNGNLDLQTPRWAVPLLAPSRYKAAWGGRSGGKSHFFAELAVEEMLEMPNLPFVCLREIQKTLKHSVKRLIEQKIKDMRVRSSFKITDHEIARVGGEGLFIFQGMQDHTADSIKSLEGFMRAWVEEAQKFSARSWRLLRPTIRAPGSQIWASWNPEFPIDPVDEFFRGGHLPNNAIVVKVNYTDNPFMTEESYNDAKADKERDEEEYEHVWMGGYNFKSEAVIFAGKWVEREFDISKMGSPKMGAKYVPAGPYYGLDFGFSQDPTAALRCWIWDECLFIDYALGKKKLELSDTNEMVCQIPGADRYKIVGDSARPETINHMRKPWKDSSGRNRPGLNVAPCEKWSGSIEDGIEYLLSFRQIVIHPRCVGMIYEAKNYKYRIDRFTEEILATIEDKDNHFWDALRYALNKHIQTFKSSGLDWL